MYTLEKQRKISEKHLQEECALKQEFISLVPTSQETRDVCTEVIGVYSEHFTEHMNILLREKCASS
jgi:hypothetical protein